VEEPLFSIVTVTLNCADDAVRTAQSVLAQDYTNYEYIVKDGGSQDGTVERLSALGVTSTVSRDTGIYSAMNQALALCHGRYVYFLNAGDTLYHPRVLSSLTAEMDLQSAIVYGRIVLAPSNRTTHPPSKLSRYYFFRKNLNHQSWLARLDVYRELGGFDTQYRYVADQDFLWRVLLWHKHTSQYVDLVIATFVYGGASTRKSAKKDVRRERWSLLQRFFTLPEIALYGLAGLYFLNPIKARIRNMLFASAVHEER
jgi:putative colanic acid biosynthesis glycosyltransferase